MNSDQVKKSGKVDKVFPMSPYKTGLINFRYIWRGSIPDSWDKVIKKNKIQKIKIFKEKRNTLAFLEETQKYIQRITMPSCSKDVEVTPTLWKLQKEFQKTPSLSTLKSPGVASRKANVFKRNISSFAMSTQR